MPVGPPVSLVAPFDHYAAYGGHGFADIHSFHGGGLWSSLGGLAAKAIGHLGRAAVSAGKSAALHGLTTLAQGGNIRDAGHAALRAGTNTALHHGIKTLSGGGMTSRPRKRRRQPAL